DNIVTTTAITFTNKPLVIVPAMNTRMWENPAVQNNIKLLKSFPNVVVVPPDKGLLACGETGEGKLADLESIKLHVYQATHPNKDLYKGKTYVVTTGGTVESIDSVRTISNISSGKMGLAIADELFAMGANVILVHTLEGDVRKPYETVSAKSVKQLEVATKKAFEKADGLIMAAAVSDFTVENPAVGKIKKQAKMTLELVKTHDFLVDIGNSKKPGQVVVGFAAEAVDLITNAKGKLEKKNLDMIVANDISRKDIGFKSDENEVTLLFREGENKPLPKASKSLIARGLLTELHQRVVTPKPVRITLVFA
ncbi:MAG: bifunctional phosphopantothenoylcysteine decarboxylase/phosphopantothenate--cysteine ligase CoaBC, partial [Cyanobacteria bacterium]|nr:bifunctional phosphopantothenoylcysteine decarboxylase/phosphopantothenate--cysteine ligase CoaBC [Cyanobacteriota bacterium]